VRLWYLILSVAMSD
jgi:hypothetical protein